MGRAKTSQGVKSICAAAMVQVLIRLAARRRKDLRTFLTNHLPQTAAVDFFTVPTVAFRVLFVFVVLAHEGLRVVHFVVIGRHLTENLPPRTRLLKN
jgi:hypothetical protein